MNPKPKAASEKKSRTINIRLTPMAYEEINRMADVHGFDDNRSKFIELAARGMIPVDRKKAGLE